MKILVVVDMQNDFINGTLGTKEAVNILDNVQLKIKEYHKSGSPVIFTRDTHRENYLDTQEGRNLPVLHCVYNTKGWQISEQLEVADSVIIDKPTFGSTKLAQYIQTQYPDTDLEIELIGLCTDICVISNAVILKAFFPEARIMVDASCCAGVTPDSHKNALEAMKMCQISIVNEKE
jgi:nicotinamidase-related amidase